MRKDDGNGNILLSRVEAADVLAWDKLKELKQTGEAIDVVVKGIVNSGVVAYVEGVRGFIPASKLALTYVEDTNEYLNKPLKVQVIDVDKANGKLILSAKELLREQAGDRVKVKVTAVKDGKLSLSIKEATDMMAKEIEEEVIELPDSKEEASTSLGALFANLKLN